VPRPPSALDGKNGNGTKKRSERIHEEQSGMEEKEKEEVEIINAT